jgi:quinol monooxygenase YgiN
MPYFVAIQRRAWPDRLHDLLAAIRRSFAASRTAAPGRHAARVFQRLNEPTTLLSLAECDSQAAFEAYQASPTFAGTTDEIGPPPVIEPLRRLYLFERMNERAVVIACATLTVPGEHEDAALEYLMGPAQLSMVSTPGLVCRELYRGSADDRPASRFLVVHGWRSIADLDRFRSGDVTRFEDTLATWGATMERFTGEVAIEYSRLDQPGDA